MKPLRSIEYAATRCLLNPARPYVNAVNTDIRATFARVRAEQIAAAKPSKVRRIR